MIISVVTTCLNAEKTIKETIESVLSQKGDFELEYIITDGGSTDGTLETINSYGERIRLVDASGLNQSEGINLGLQLSTGEIVTFLNADDLYEKNALCKVAKYFDSNNTAKWVMGKCIIIDGNNNEVFRWITMYKNLLMKNYSYPLLLIDNFISQPGVFLKRELLEEFGYFDTNENYVMDYDYWLRVGMRYKPGFINKTLAKFRRTHETKSNRKFYKQFRDDLRVSWKYMQKKFLHILLPLKFLSYLKTIFVYSFIIK